jgi:hypothetical protein
MTINTLAIAAPFMVLVLVGITFIVESRLIERQKRIEKTQGNASSSQGLQRNEKAQKKASYNLRLPAEYAHIVRQNPMSDYY